MKKDMKMKNPILFYSLRALYAIPMFIVFGYLCLSLIKFAFTAYKASIAVSIIGASICYIIGLIVRCFAEPHAVQKGMGLDYYKSLSKEERKYFISGEI